ncbi:MAG TPA: M48 family metallopeptidase [Noviherbaspirillum sp.]|uniref:M48 family metallopeptidase n=1 Tax=Noviherbaspirillum sp. TaxID=1926288 RepID=UPI002B481372|nr:M48 family metallopeptidase [Noviherbaspirillum sp.]HJV85626.1 M48 family metallopeptidase [Noviherbaspirillum sp.]
MKPIVSSLIMRRVFVALAVVLLAACETVQTTQSGAVGITRPQHMIVSSEAIDDAARQEYTALIADERKKGELNQNPAEVARVRAIVNRLIPTTAAFRPDALKWNWEVNVIKSPEVNAWCMPGGKIAVYTGLIEKLHLTDDELAAVLGHEMAHALREHARERASEQAVASTAISVGAAVLGIGDLGQKTAEYAYMGLLGLPNSRRHETEADRIGVELAARAGYDPRAAISLWQKMEQVGSPETIKFLSTHPPREERLADLTNYSARVMPLYEQAKKQH